MQSRIVATVFVVVAFTGACAGDSPTSVPPDSFESFAVPMQGTLTGNHCENLTLDVDADIGAWQFNGETVIGGLPNTNTFAGVTGQLGSIITGQTQTGHATHLTLMHVFLSEAGTFFTEDRAICAQAGNDPTKCLINDDMRIVGGTGVFEDVSGFMHNTARLDFVAGTLVGTARGRICASTL